MQLGVTDHVWSIGELIDATLDGELPSGSGPEFPKNLDSSDTIQSLPSVQKLSVIQGGKGTTYDCRGWSATLRAPGYGEHPMSKAALLSATAIAIVLSGAAPLVAKQPAHKPYTVLYDQNSNFGVGVISDNFSSTYSSYDSAAADDFVVPSGQIWHVAEVDVTGMYFNGSGPAKSEVVAFYTNTRKGKPGRVHRGPFALNCTDNTGSFQCILPKRVKLASGTWWVSVVANCSFSGCGEWGWVTNSVVHGYGAVWEQGGGHWKRLKPLTDLTFTLIGKP